MKPWTIAWTITFCPRGIITMYFGKTALQCLLQLGPRSVLAVLRNEDVRSMPEAYFMAGVV